MADQWSSSRYPQRDGSVMYFGRRTTSMTAVRKELGAAIPEAWHLAKVMRDGDRVGFGVGRTREDAAALAQLEAGLARPEVVHHG